MADDLTIREPADKKKINTSEAYEMNWWSKKFGVSKDRLLAACKKAGPMAADVERELKK